MIRIDHCHVYVNRNGLRSLIGHLLAFAPSRQWLLLKAAAQCTARCRVVLPRPSPALRLFGSKAESHPPAPSRREGNPPHLQFRRVVSWRQLPRPIVAQRSLRRCSRGSVDEPKWRLFLCLSVMLPLYCTIDSEVLRFVKASALGLSVEGPCPNAALCSICKWWELSVMPFCWRCIL